MSNGLVLSIIKNMVLVIVDEGCIGNGVLRVVGDDVVEGVSNLEGSVELRAG